MTEIASNRENNRETEDIKDEWTSEVTASYEEGVRREAGWSGEGQKEEENPERKRTKGEINKQDAVEEGGNFGSDGVRGVEDQKEGISHGRDKALVDTEEEEGIRCCDEGRSGMERNKQTVDHEARKIRPRGETSVDYRNFKNTKDKKGDGDSEEGRSNEEEDGKNRTAWEMSGGGY